MIEERQKPTAIEKELLPVVVTATVKGERIVIEPGGQVIGGNCTGKSSGQETRKTSEENSIGSLVELTVSSVSERVGVCLTSDKTGRERSDGRQKVRGLGSDRAVLQTVKGSSG